MSDLVYPFKRINKNEKIIKEEQKPLKNNKEKEYILLYYATEDGKDIKSFEKIKGRKNIYEFIKGMIEYIDIYESLVLVETVPFKDSVNVYDFMKYCEQYFDDSFDIEDYNY